MGVGLRARGGVMDLARGCTQVEGTLLDRRHMLLQVVFIGFHYVSSGNVSHQSDYMSITIMWVVDLCLQTCLKNVFQQFQAEMTGTHGVRYLAGALCARASTWLKTVRVRLINFLLTH